MNGREVVGGGGGRAGSGILCTTSATYNDATPTTTMISHFQSFIVNLNLQHDGNNRDCVELSERERRGGDCNGHKLKMNPQ